MNEEKLRKKRTCKSFRRKRALEKRIKCHGNKDNCSFHSRRIIKKVVKKSWWRKIIDWFKNL